MVHNKRSLRRVVLGRMWDTLDVNFGSTVGRQDFVDGAMSMRDIDGFLSFKSDPVLEELRSALLRIDQGTYGVCISCKRQMSAETLFHDPARRMCPECEHAYNKAPAFAQHAVPH
jgi:RNA polymerase-binding transcription factor DksA